MRQAAEKSLEELKSLRVSNEAQFGAGERAFTSSAPMHKILLWSEAVFERLGFQCLPFWEQMHVIAN